MEENTPVIGSGAVSRPIPRKLRPSITLDGVPKDIKQKKLLGAYAHCGILRNACEYANTSRGMHNKWLREDPLYAQQFAEAHEDAMDRLEAEAIRRGCEGWEEPVIYQGGLCYPNVNG